jgi:Papain-like cysteine protease AvrRpt2
MRSNIQLKTAIFLFLFVLPLGPFAQAQGTDSMEIFMPLRTQHTNVWCWAAAIGMVVEYTKGFAIQDCEVLNEYELRNGGRGLCCLASPECNRTGKLSEMSSIMGGIFKIQGGYRHGPLAFDELVKHIDKKKPILAALMFGKNGHVAVIAGYQKSSKSLIIYDPAHGRVVAPYASLVSKTTSPNWLGSFMIESPRSVFPKCKRMTVTESEEKGPRLRIECE